MDIVNRIYFESSNKSNFNIKPSDNDIIKEIKKILFRWFPKGAKYNYKFDNIHAGTFIILYKKRLYFYDIVRKSNGKLKIELYRFHIINKKLKKYKCIYYNYKRIEFMIYKYNKDPISIYSKTKYRRDNSPYVYDYKMGKLVKSIRFCCNDNNIKKTYYNNKFFCYDNISFCYKYIYNNIFITKNKSEKKYENLIFNGQFRCFLLFI